MKIAVLFFVLCSSFFTLCAQPLSEREIIEKMAAAAREIRTVQCDFTQIKHTKLLKKEQVSEGRMFCQQPDKLRWEYTSPRASVILLDGTEGEGPKNKFIGSMARLIMNSVAGKSLTDSKTFQVTAEERPTAYVATLIPLRKDLKRIYTKLVLHFDIQQSTVTRVEMHEKNGDYTVIDLRGIRINE